MATESAVATRWAPPDPTRNVWQVPFFFTAVLAFMAVWQGWVPIGPPDECTLFAQDLDNLRNAYERVTPNRDELKELLIKVAANLDKCPAQAQASHYLLASGYERLAELTPAVEESRGYWMLAQQHFGVVEIERFAGTPDENKLRYRRAKARAAVGLPEGTPAKEVRNLIDLLLTQTGDDPGEAGRLAADLALKVNELGIAKEALASYLRGGLAVPSINRDRAKILLAEVFFRLKDMSKAKERLDDVSPDAPPELFAASRALLARVDMELQNWKEATTLWERVRTIPSLPPSLHAIATYQLGVCKLHTNDPETAAKLFEEVLKGPDSAETVAAAFHLADLYLNTSDPAKHAATADLLTRAMKDVKDVKDLRGNPNIKSIPTEVNGPFELAPEKLIADGGFEAALKVAAAFTPLAENGQDHEKRAKVLAAWAESLKKSGADFIPKAIEAAKEYAAFADLQKAATARAEALRQAAAMYRLAGKPEEAVTVLQAASKLAGLPEAYAGPIWVSLADSLLEARRPDEVWPALNEAMKVGGPISTKIRLQLALHFKDLRQPEFSRLACLLYEQIAKQTNITSEEQEYQERAMVELAHEYIRNNNFDAAEHWLRIQLHSYKTGPEAPLGRLLLGVALLQMASAPPPAGPTATKSLEMRTEALRLFRSIVTEVDTRPKMDTLSERDAWLRTQAALRILQAHQQLRNFDDLLQDAMTLRERYHGAIEELIILSLMYHAFKEKGDIRNAMETWTQMKKAFDQLPASSFRDVPGEYNREYWEKNWFTPDKQ